MTPNEHMLHVILPNNHAQILLVPHDSGGWTLPTIPPPESIARPYEMFEFGMSIHWLLGREVVPLRCAFFQYQNDDYGHRFVFVVENSTPVPQPVGRWIAGDALKNLALTHEYLHPILETYFHEQATGEYPPERSPWAFPGWQARAKAWIREQVVAQGWHLTGGIELRRKWCITCVMRVPTSVGDLFFKAVPPTFAREIAITRYLAEQHPEHIPSIVACHEAERWILLRDFGQQLLGDSKEIADWERAVREFAALQMNMMGHIDALFEREVLDYRLEVLPEKFDALLADGTMLKPNHRITAEEIERVRSLAPRIKALIDEVRTYNIPATISHSDFHPWNSAVRGERTIFFDWTDASVGHPFLDLGHFFDRMSEEIFKETPEAVERLRAIYLQSLTALAPLETLQKALSLGELLGLIHQLVNYRHLLYQIEPAERWSLDIIGSMMKRLLVQLDKLD